MEDYIIKQIDMIGRMLLALARKLGLLDGNVANYTMQSVQKEIQQSGLEMNIDHILSEEHPIVILVETFNFSNEAIETFTEIVMNSDAEESTKRMLLGDAIAYLDSKGHYSFALHSYLS